MDVKVTIELEGSADDVNAWLARLGQLMPATTVAATTDASATTTSSIRAEGWGDGVVERLVHRITPLARDALRYMASNAPTVSFGELQDHMGLGGVQIGGVLASFGFAENAGLPRPYRVDKKARRYVIDPSVAEIVLEALRSYDEDHE